MMDGEYGRARLDSMLKNEGRTTLLDQHLRITLALHSDTGMSRQGVVLGDPQQTCYGFLSGLFE